MSSKCRGNERLIKIWERDRERQKTEQRQKETKTDIYIWRWVISYSMETYIKRERDSKLYGAWL